MTNESRHWARLLFGGVGLFALSASVGACSSDKASQQAASISVVTQAPTSLPVSSTIIAATTDTTIPPIPVTTPPIDGTALLSQAFAAAAPAYHFTSTVTVDGVVAATADGDRIGDNSRLTITGNGGAFKYIILGQTLSAPGATWVKPDGGEWQALESAPATTDPIAALKKPLSVTVSSTTTEATQLVVTVTPASLGLAGDTPLPMQITISGTTLQAVNLTTTVSGKAATVHTTLGPVKNATSIVAPI